VVAVAVRRRLEVIARPVLVVQAETGQTLQHSLQVRPQFVQVAAEVTVRLQAARQVQAAQAQAVAQQAETEQQTQVQVVAAVLPVVTARAELFT
jgi:small neutral amino acid transporter SnatA (MarC family)